LVLTIVEQPGASVKCKGHLEGLQGSQAVAMKWYGKCHCKWHYKWHKEW